MQFKSCELSGDELLFSGEPVSVIERKLDACTVSVYPPLNPDHESLTVPETMLGQLGIVQKVSNDGIFLTGADMIYNYEQVSFSFLVGRNMA